MNLRPDSLRGRLLLLLIGPLVVLLAAAIVADYQFAVEPALAAYDHALADDAAGIAAQLRARGNHLDINLPSEAISMLMKSAAEDEEFFRVIGPRNEWLIGERDLPMPPAGKSALSFVDAHYRGRPVRMAILRTFTSLGPVTIQVAETTLQRQRTGERILLAMVWPNLMLILATLLLIVFGVRVGLQPLMRLSQEIEARSPRDLHSLSETPAPRETRPLVRAINRLLALLRDASDAQQKFLANAAHQLRTPLAGLQTQLELTAEEASPEMRPRIDQLSTATRRLGHLAHQLLALARAAPEASLAHERHAVDLPSLVEEAVSAHLDMALARDIDLGLEAAPAQVNGSGWLLRELLANLIDNAVMYTQQGGVVTVRCGHIGKDAFMEVEDNGPGVPAADRERIFERFYRARNVQGEGSGLGLAIVREIADAHGAQISLTTPDGGGTRIRASFPAD
ncbi:MAG: sensor histidine kinase [Zoogloea sp.]|nr:sensor histidine kinase [Zoogloea sp.]